MSASPPALVAPVLLGLVLTAAGGCSEHEPRGFIELRGLCKDLGADILRLWVASTDYSGELSISKEILKRVVEAYRRVRNTLRFLLANVSDFDAAKDVVPAAQMLEIDRWALARAAELQAEFLAHYERFEFHPVVAKLQVFCSEDLGAFYLDVLKDRLYTTAPKSLARRSAQTALWQITHAMLRWMAPFLSFTAEEAWQVFASVGQREASRHDAFALPVMLCGAGGQRREQSEHVRHVCVVVLRTGGRPAGRHLWCVVNDRHRGSFRTRCGREDNAGCSTYALLIRGRGAAVTSVREHPAVNIGGHRTVGLIGLPPAAGRFALNGDASQVGCQPLYSLLAAWPSWQARQFAT